MAGLDFCTKCEMGVTTMSEAGELAQGLLRFEVKISPGSAARM
jgi:hypothetical protein